MRETIWRVSGGPSGIERDVGFLVESIFCLFMLSVFSCEREMCEDKKRAGRPLGVDLKRILGDFFYFFFLFLYYIFFITIKYLNNKSLEKLTSI